MDELAGGLDCEHVVTRSVRDTALMLELTAGPDALCRVPLKLPKALLPAADVRGLRIGVTLPAPGGMQPNAEIAAAVLHAADVLRRGGHQVGEFKFPASADIGTPAAIIWMSVVAEEIDFYRARVGRPAEAHELEALTRASIEVGDRYSALDYVRARRALSTATREMAALFDRFDVLLMPTTAELPVLTGQIDGRTAAFNLQRWNADSYGYAPYTEIFNASGQPAVSLPLATSATGLPIGVQCAAALGNDALLLSLAAWLERELPWEPRLKALSHRFASN
jgi:amidase